MAATLAQTGLVKQAEQSMMDDIRLRVSLLSNPEWRRQMEESHKFFTSGGKGRTLSDLGRE
jgi:hypothetical protein